MVIFLLLFLAAASIAACCTGRLRLDILITIFALMISAAVGFFAVNYYNGLQRAKARARNYCINNLRQIDGAIEQWALESRKTTNDAIVVREVAKYVKGQDLPKCPSGGIYSVGKFGAPPQCSVPGHTVN
jgi:hypothetical protein